MRFGRALSWSMGAELSARLVQPASFVVLTTMLTPVDVGVAAAAMIVVTFCEVLWQAGMGKALIQTTADLKKAADAAFWVNLALSATVIVVLLLTAPILAKEVFGDARVADVIRALCVFIALGAFCSVQLFLLQRAMDFRSLFWVRLTTEICILAVSLPMAFLGFGYWAIIIGTIAGQVAQVLLLLHWRVYTPRLTVDTAILRQMLRFGFWVLASGLLGWFYAWADALAVGIFLQPTDLGLYRTAALVVGFVYGAIFAPANPVIYSHLSRFHADGASIRPAFAAAVRLITLLAVPLSFCLYVLAPYVEMYVLGPQWRGIAFIAAHLSLMTGFSAIASANGEAYRAIGKPYLEAVVPASMLLVYLAGYLLSLQHGLHAFVYTRVGLAFAALIVHLAIARLNGILVLGDIASSLAASVLGGFVILMTFQVQVRLAYLPTPLEALYAVPSLALSAGLLFALRRRTLRADARLLTTAG